ncbi:hypothetical protein B0H34DRAFT_713626 [Crassisporium funariophilum]|nr:hypothetical protein B0H34DRAFT_713626 [Crassisporium funariophilum]
MTYSRPVRDVGVAAPKGNPTLLTVLVTPPSVHPPCCNRLCLVRCGCWWPGLELGSSSHTFFGAS